MENVFTQAQDPDEDGLTLCVNGVHIHFGTSVEYVGEPDEFGDRQELEIQAAWVVGLCDGGHCWQVTEDIVKLADQFKSNQTKGVLKYEYKDSPKLVRDMKWGRYND
jgi:hypothetical protein